MKDLNICIDIDGTITEPYYWLEPYNKHFGKNVTEEDVTQYNICEILDISEEEHYKFYDKYKYKLHWDEQILSDAPGFINKLSKDHYIYFVTAREKSLTMLTHAYLKYHKFKYDDLFLLGSHYKVEKAKELGCDIFIEDSASNALELSEAGFKVLLFDTNYNRIKLNDNIVRIYNWKEIYSKINDLLLQEDAM